MVGKEKLEANKDSISLENKTIKITSLKTLFSEAETLEDGNRVTDYLKNKRGGDRKSKKFKQRQLEDFGISGGIPQWEICLRRNCPSLGKCYDSSKPNHPLYEIKSCDKLKVPLLSKYGKLKHKADLTPRDWSLIYFALGKITYSDVKDERLDYTREVVRQISEYSTTSKVIV